MVKTSHRLYLARARNFSGGEDQSPTVPRQGEGFVLVSQYCPGSDKHRQFEVQYPRSDFEADQHSLEEASVDNTHHAMEYWSRTTTEI